MSGGMYGADIEALRLLADKIAEGGDTLDTVVLTVEGAIPGPDGWEGPDGDGFRAEWGDTHVVQLRSTADLLRDVASKVRENADDQQGTSDDYTGTAGGPGGPGGSAGGGGGGGGGGGAGDAAGDDGGNPLPTPGADPTHQPDPNDPLDQSVHRDAAPGTLPAHHSEAHGTFDDQGNFTPSQNGQDAATPVERGDVHHTFAEGETGGFAGYEQGVDGDFGSDDGVHGSGEAGVSAGAGYDASGSVTASENGVVAEGAVGVNAGAGASTSGEVGYGDHLGAQGSAEAFVGARAEATGGVSVGPHGLGVGAGFDAFAGAEASAEGSVTAAGVTAEAGVTGYAGVGVTANADVNVGLDSVAVDLELGAALGIGAGFDVSFDWSPADTVDAITDVGGDFVDGITGGWW
ncbi:hypothetical protein UQW22_01165 [Isoptericola halotolerans]|uniref:hypothetical protein n=1 Tax=Isoptericola halotolerans TaxID=300560 RepID=UPI00389058F8